jgi:hypothetical protein
VINSKDINKIELLLRKYGINYEIYDILIKESKLKKV